MHQPLAAPLAQELRKDHPQRCRIPSRPFSLIPKAARPPPPRLRPPAEAGSAPPIPIRGKSGLSPPPRSRARPHPRRSHFPPALRGAAPLVARARASPRSGPFDLTARCAKSRPMWSASAPRCSSQLPPGGANRLPNAIGGRTQQGALRPRRSTRCAATTRLEEPKPGVAPSHRGAETGDHEDRAATLEISDPFRSVQKPCSA